MKRILTGDRPTGKLHLGHYVGTLKSRLELQNEGELFIFIADLHSLTTKPEKEHITQIARISREMLLDYLSIGLDPRKTTFYRQSALPEIPYLALLLGMNVSAPRLQRMPTLKEVLRDLKRESASYGLLGYPVLMAADILIVKATHVPVGEDQEAHVELAREIARTFNGMYGEVFPIPEIVSGKIPRLVGTDGQAKMSKSLDNAIYLSDDADTVREKVMEMYTDPARIHADVPGNVEDNPVFIYHDAFNSNKDEVAELKARYQQGKVKDIEVKEKLAAALNSFLDPVRVRRAKFENPPAGGPEKLDQILERGTKRARAEAQKTLEEARQAMGLVQT